MAQDNFEEQIGKRKLGLAPPNINVTPLVDVLLVLLIIFFVIQPRKEAKFESQIPQKPEPQAEENAVPPQGLLLVEVKTGAGLDQAVELNSQPMTLLELGPRLAAEFERRERDGVKDNTVYLKAKKDKPYGDIVHVIDVLKGAGAHPIGLQLDYLEP